MKNLILVAITSLSLAACSGFTGNLQGNSPGMATYEINRTQDGDCRVRISSGRDIAVGSIKVGADCTLDAQAKSLNGNEAQVQTLNLVNELMKKIP